MIVEGKWVLGLGDSSPEVRKIKAFMRRMFSSYAGVLADTELYDQQMVNVVTELQRRYGIPVGPFTGTIGYSLKVKMHYIQAPPVATIFTVNGTGVPDPFGPGFAGDVARGVLAQAPGMYGWQPIGYPADVFPMGGSSQKGRVELVNQINRYAGKIVLVGYSQGAIVTNLVWTLDILPVNGSLHHRLSDVIAIINYGDPMRCPGIANGNKLAGQPMPGMLDGAVTGGIAGPGCLTAEQTPEFLLSYALDGDLYACAPVGNDPWHKETEVGHNETMIFNLVMGASLTNLFALAMEAMQIVTMPMAQVIPLIEAIVNGLKFASQGTNAPHWRYDVGPAIKGLIWAGNAARAAQQ